MKSFSTILLLFISSHIYGQFNSKIGYTGAYVQLGGVNTLFTSFDEANPWLDKQLNGISVVHGLELGGRYSFDSFSAEFGLALTNGKARAAGQLAGVSEQFRWKSSMYDYHFNLVQQFGFTGVGVGIVNQRITMKQYSGAAAEFVEISKESNIALNLFLNFEVPSSKVSLAVRPYYKRSLSSYSYAEVASALNVDNNSAVQNMGMIGLSVLFFNGPQRR